MSDPIAQIGLCYTTGFWGRVIRKVTKSNRNHVVVRISAGYCMGAEPGGVRVRPIGDFPDVVWSRFNLTRVEQTKILTFMHAHLNARYNYADNAAIGIALLSGINTPKWVERIVSDPDSWQCAQLADAAYQYAGRILFDDGRLDGAVFPGSYVPIFHAEGWPT